MGILILASWVDMKLLGKDLAQCLAHSKGSIIGRYNDAGEDNSKDNGKDDGNCS